MQKILWLLVLFIVCLPDSALTANRALLIGVGKYQHVKNLDGVDNDLANMKKLLFALGWNKDEIIVHNSSADGNMGTQPTVENITNWVTEHLINETQPSDTAFLYFSGHGSTVEDQNGDESGQPDMVLVTYDTQVLPTSGGSSRLVNIIRDDEISKWIQKIPAKQTFLVFDACSSGSITRGGVQKKILDYAGRPKIVMTRGYFTSAPKGRYVALSAAADGTAALQTKDGGLLTQSLCAAANKMLRAGNGADLTMQYLFEQSKDGITSRAMKLRESPHEPFLAIGNKQLTQTSLCLNGKCRNSFVAMSQRPQGQLASSKMVEMLPDTNSLLVTMRSIVDSAGQVFTAKLDKTFYRRNEPMHLQAIIPVTGYLNFFIINPIQNIVSVVTPTLHDDSVTVRANSALSEPGRVLQQLTTDSPGEEYILMVVTKKRMPRTSALETLEALLASGREIRAASTVRFQVR